MSLPPRPAGCRGPVAGDASMDAMGVEAGGPATDATRRTEPENVIIIHWHDLGRHLACYGADGVSSPHLDALAAEGIRFGNAHATAPLCSPARGSLFTGQYPHRNGLVGLAHHGFGYRDGTHTLPGLLGAQGYTSCLIGMQHESTDPSSLGFDSVDVSESRCDYVVAEAEHWIRDRAAAGDQRPFLLTAGFFETHRPYPEDEYEPSDTSTIEVPAFLPDTTDVRDDLAGLHGSIGKADAAVGRLLATVDAAGLRGNTWIVFTTDHGLAFPRAKSTLYEEGTGIAFIVRPPARRDIAPFVYDDLFSGVDLTPTLLDLLGAPIPGEIDGESHADALQTPPGQTSPAGPVRDAVFTEKTYHDAYDPIRAVRTARYRYIENYAARPELLLPLDIADSLSARSLDPRQETSPRAAAELYDLISDPTEQNNLIDDPHHAEVRETLRARLAEWREDTGDQLPSETEGTDIAERFMADFFAKAQDTAPEEEALPSRRPRGERRELTGRVREP